MTFSDDLKAQGQTPRPIKDVDVIINDQLYTFRFRQMDGLEWAAECDKHPARLDSTIDSFYGYNLRTLTIAVAPRCGVRLDGETEIPLVVEAQHPLLPANPNLVNEWRDLFAAIGGAGFQDISDALFALNQYDPAQAVEEAKKARAALTRKSASQSRSGSRQSGSSAGNRKKSPTTRTTKSAESPAP